MNTRQRGIGSIAIILITLAVLLLDGLIYYYLVRGAGVGKEKKAEPQEESLAQKKPAEKEPVKEPIVEAIADCGEFGPDKLDQAQESKDCFDLKFKNCNPAKIVMSIDIGPLGGLLTYYYEIIGPENGLCKVKSKFLKNPNLDWIGKEMTCRYDNKKDFEAAVQEIVQDWSRCEGPLRDLMTLKHSPSEFSPPDTTKTITLQDCSNQEGVPVSINEYGTACLVNQVDLGTVLGIEASVCDKSGLDCYFTPMQCCK